MKTSELTGAALDWAVAQCEGVNVIICPGNVYPHLVRKHNANGSSINYVPSTEWTLGGPIIEERVIELTHWGMDDWKARDTNYQFLNTPQERPVFAEGYGPTALIAAMRCFVASVKGEEIDIPKELL